MREVVRTAIVKSGLDIARFEMGSNAGANSEIWLTKSLDDIKIADYAIQFCDEKSAFVIWNLIDRKSNGFSLKELSWTNSAHWNDDIFDGITVEIEKKNKSSKSARMAYVVADAAELFFTHIENFFGEEEIEDVDENITIGNEGGKYKVYSTRYERDPDLRREAIRIHGTTCKVCGFNFEDVYGDVGKGFIEVHHIKPLSSVGKSHPVDPETDLTCVCANCHRMLHSDRKFVKSIEELRRIVQRKSLGEKNEF